MKELTEQRVQQMIDAALRKTASQVSNLQKEVRRVKNANNTLTSHVQSLKNQVARMGQR